jgi:hypothetical protein
MSTNMNYYEQEQQYAIISDSGIKMFYNACSQHVCVINAQCNYCKKNMRMKSVSRHLEKCNPDSPLFEGTFMCDGGDDIIVYKAKK